VVHDYAHKSIPEASMHSTTWEPNFHPHPVGTFPLGMNPRVPGPGLAEKYKERNLDSSRFLILDMGRSNPSGKQTAPAKR
jgi:hypothetical protein